MLPDKLRFELFDRLSIQTMRYVKSVPRREASGLVKEVYEMIADDFFMNGSLTSHSKVPELLAGVWTGGRESMLVDDHIDRTRKEMLTAAVSNVNECAYCGDMLVSLVHAGDQHDTAKRLYGKDEGAIEDSELRELILWTKAMVTDPKAVDMPLPFAPEALPEVIASIMAISHINRFSHIVMDGSPVKPVLGSEQIKGVGLRMFGRELKSTKRRPLVPDRTKGLLPEVALPEDMQWAEGNPRIARAFARWSGAIDREARAHLPERVVDFVESRVGQWDGSLMPLSRAWVEVETEGLFGGERDLARFALIVAKSAPQMDEALVKRVFSSEVQFIRLLAWASFTGARQVAANVALKAGSLVAA